MKWRVYNMHSQGFTHREKFRDEMIEIKAGEYVLMDYEDAVLFKGQFFPIKLDAMNVQDPISYKMIKIEPDGEVTEQAKEIRYVCHVDGKEFASKKELEAYVEAKYGDLEPFKDDSIEESLAKEAKEIQAVPKKRGPKPKETSL